MDTHIFKNSSGWKVLAVKSGAGISMMRFSILHPITSHAPHNFMPAEFLMAHENFNMVLAFSEHKLPYGLILMPT